MDVLQKIAALIRFLTLTKKAHTVVYILARSRLPFLKGNIQYAKTKPISPRPQAVLINLIVCTNYYVKYKIIEHIHIQTYLMYVDLIKDKH